MKKHFLLLLLAFTIFNSTCEASIVGSDITYTCTGTPNVWKITFTLFRNCSGAKICQGNCGAPCLRSLGVTGNDPDFYNQFFGTFNVNLVKVEDVNTDPLCPGTKSICSNMNCVTPGTYTPGIEKYVFEGLVDLGSMSIPAGCCNTRIAFGECCRDSNTTTNGGEPFYTFCVINRCTAANTPCNSSPVISNDAFAIICGGQPYVFNNGALDLDFDSLSFSFAPLLTGVDTVLPLDSPYAHTTPMPWTGPANAPFPAGIRCDPLTGDIMFTPPSGGGNPFAGIMVVEVYQWRTINSAPMMIGTTRREIKMIVTTCPSNNPPAIKTRPPHQTIPSQPKTYWEVCAGEQLCFEVIATDPDVDSTAMPPLSDTTWLSWNGQLASLGATFTPKYNPMNRRKPAPLGGPRQDSFEFCWQTTASMARSLPYYFSIKARDMRCPVPGTTTRTFGIKVNEKPATPVLTGPTQVPRNEAFTYNVTPVSGASYTWYVSNGAINSGQNSPSSSITFTNKGPGLVQLLDSVGGCAGDTGSLTIEVGFGTGFRDETIIKKFNMFPNPTQGSLTIEFNTEERSIQFEVIDRSGAVVLRSSAEHAGGLLSETLDVSTLGKGIYVLRISARGQKAASESFLKK